MSSLTFDRLRVSELTRGMVALEDGRMRCDDAQEDAGGTGRTTTALLPILQGAETHAHELGEFALRCVEALANLNHLLRGVDGKLTRRLPFAADNLADLQWGPV